MEPLHRTRQLTIAYERRHLLSTYRVIVVAMLGTALCTAAHAGRTRLQGTGAVSQEPLYELLAIPATPRLEALLQVRGHALRAPCAAPQPTEQHHVQAKIPLEAAFHVERVTRPPRRCNVVKDLHPSFGSVDAQLLRHIADLAARVDDTIGDR